MTISHLQSIQKITETLLKQVKQSDFAGQDPFDGLNSRFFNLFPRLKKSLFGLAVIQFHKRSVFNLRALFLVPQKRNPKGIALFVLGLLEDYKATKEQSYLAQAIELADWLITEKSDKNEWQHSCWGYHFDWNARAFFVPKGKPNVITTIYVAQALYALFEITQNNKYKNPAIDAAHFIVETLYIEHGDRSFFAYIPGETTFVHNASLWGAAWVAFVGNVTDNKEYKNLALKVARQSVKEQGSNGSWVYGSRHHHQFIDGFHTGYNLEALDFIQKTLSINEFDSVISKGLAYYKRELIEEDGSAKYYANNRYPLDMHSVTQAVLTLLKVGGTDEDVLLAEKIIQRSIDTLYMPNKGQFVYQKNKHFTNKINYIRWTQAWVYYSFAYYNRFVIEK